MTTIDSVIGSAAQELQMSADQLMVEGVRLLLSRRLRDINARIFEITGRYGISTVQEMVERYETGQIDEATSWRDYQDLDHLQYKQNRLLELIETLE
ncbi:MAG: hypothetical protein KJZ86_17720 [Caldilineaceae bacterium]|nr:hypothetical protein [Caldilineaceae bacterium]HRJ44825.1 hypothetical protein [Caldilineaceae bacterium]